MALGLPTVALTELIFQIQKPPTKADCFRFITRPRATFGLSLKQRTTPRVWFKSVVMALGLPMVVLGESIVQLESLIA